MAYSSTKPANGTSLVSADIRENFRALKEDSVVLPKTGTGATDACAGNDARLLYDGGQLFCAPISGSVTGTTYVEIASLRLYIPTRAENLMFSGYLSCTYGAETAQLRLVIGALTSPVISRNGGYAWVDAGSVLDVSSVAGSRQTISVQLSCSHVSGNALCSRVSAWINKES